MLNGSGDVCVWYVCVCAAGTVLDRAQTYERRAPTFHHLSLQPRDGKVWRADKDKDYDRLVVGVVDRWYLLIRVARRRRGRWTNLHQFRKVKHRGGGRVTFQTPKRK